MEMPPPCEEPEVPEGRPPAPRTRRGECADPGGVGQPTACSAFKRGSASHPEIADACAVASVIRSPAVLCVEVPKNGGQQCGVLKLQPKKRLFS
ncbi:hypothetical protein VULLAG_LOCUS20352 [Vulpes lagopus]